MLSGYTQLGCYILENLYIKRPLSEDESRDWSQFMSERYVLLPFMLKCFVLVTNTLILVHSRIFYFSSLHKLKLEKKKKLYELYKNGSLPLAGNLIQLLESFVVLAEIESPKENTDSKDIRHPESNYSPDSNEILDVIVVGSGPGGLLSASKLVDAGYKTLLIEESSKADASNYEPFRKKELMTFYRAGGINVTLGAPPIAFLEGQGIGGGSLINSALYDTPHQNIFEKWQRDYGLENCSWEDIQPYYQKIEDQFVSKFAEAHYVDQIIEKGAKGYGQSHARKFILPKDQLNESSPYRPFQGSAGGLFLPSFLDAGGKLLLGHQCLKVSKKNDIWRVFIKEKQTGNVKQVCAKKVILSAGTLRTPQILTRSKLHSPCYANFQLHPIYKVIAQYDHQVNYNSPTLGTYRVDHFAPDYFFGPGVSTYNQLALNGLKIPDLSPFKHDVDWSKLFMYSIVSRSDTHGKVICLPGLKDPIVMQSYQDEDWGRFEKSLRTLSEIVIKSGAKAVYPVVGSPLKMTSLSEVDKITSETIRKCEPLVTTVHLTSTCPMGSQKHTVVDSWGEFKGQKDLYIADASILPTSVGTNPQATLMAVVWRNIDHLINNR